MRRQLAHHFVRVPEGQPAQHQVVRHIRRQQEGVRHRRRHRFFIHLQPVHHLRIHFEGQLDGIEAVKERLLVLLHVPVVGQGQALQEGQQAHQIAIQPPGLAAGQLRHVRVLFLRHQAAAGGVGIAQGHEPELRTHPQNHILTEPRQMGAAQRQGCAQLHRKVPVRHRVHAVPGHPGKAQLLRHKFPVQHNGGPRQRSGAQRHHIEPLHRIQHPAGIAVQHFHIRQEVMGKHHRLPALQVRVARHHHMLPAQRHFRQGALQAADQVHHHPALRPAIHPDIQSHLIIAAPPRVQFRPGRPDLRRQGLLDVHVHILQGHLPLEFPRLDLPLDLLQPPVDRLHLRPGDDLRPRQGLGLRHRPQDIVFIEPPVEGDGLPIPLHQTGRLLLKSAFPHKN